MCPRGGERIDIMKVPSGCGRGEERRTVKSIVLCKLTCLIGPKSCKFLGISTIKVNK